MSTKRRFRGYCPTASRRTSNVVTGRSSRDDYTTTLNNLKVSVVAPNQIHIAVNRENPTSSTDEKKNSTRSTHELDEIGSIISQGGQDSIIRVAPFTSITRRSPALEFHQQGFVTSLSFEVPDENLTQPQGPHQSLPQALDADENTLRKSRSFPVPEHLTLTKAAEEKPMLREPTESTDASASDEVSLMSDLEIEEKTPATSFAMFRINYLIVTVAIMLADGLQGTHLYVLYEGYGFSVASLYCLGFVTGAVTSPITMPLVDRFGRKKSALLYCALEIFINMLEQYPVLIGLVASRMIGGITTNLLSSVFETWLDTEYRRQGFDPEQYEIVMRDSVVASNLAAIASGYLAHELAERLGPVGPFEGAVFCTVVALAIVMGMWTENYGTSSQHDAETKKVSSYLKDAFQTFKSDSRVLRVGIIQGCTAGSIQIFIFLWSPALRQFAQNAPSTVFGLDTHGEPAYGLIFGAFMFMGVVGGMVAPYVRQGVTLLLSPLAKSTEDVVEVEGEGKIRPMAVEFLAAFCYFVCAVLLLTPCLVSQEGPLSFSLALGAFLVYELIIGIYMPCEGVIRSLYIPADARCSLLTLPRIIVNIAVALGVVSTNFISLTTAFYSVSFLMTVSAIMQLSLVSPREWAILSGRADRARSSFARSLSFSSEGASKGTTKPRTMSLPAKILRQQFSCRLEELDEESSLIFDEDDVKKNI